MDKKVQLHVAEIRKLTMDISKLETAIKHAVQGVTLNHDTDPFPFFNSAILSLYEAETALSKLKPD